MIIRTTTSRVSFKVERTSVEILCGEGNPQADCANPRSTRKGKLPDTVRQPLRTPTFHDRLEKIGDSPEGDRRG